MKMTAHRRDSAVAAPRTCCTATRTVWSACVVAFGALVVLGSLPSSVLAKEEEYGVDVSFPIHKWDVSTNYPWLPHNVDPANNPTPKQYQDVPLQPLGDMQKAYDEFLQGCKDHYGKKGRACEQTESDRIAMNVRQPQSMQNYTDIGFKKIKAPEAVFKLVKDFWEKNQNEQSEERWPTGNTYTNHWVNPTYLVSVEDKNLRGGGSALKQAIWTAARETIQEWTGEELTQCSLYGIRVYKEGAVLASHVDRLPLVSSAIINVAQDVDEPWPIEVYGHDGKATNVTMEPGDMVLYESHSVVHGHSLRHEARMEIGEDVAEKYRRAVERGAGGHEADHDGLPSYIQRGSPEEKKWRQEHDNGRRSKLNSFATGSTSIAHRAAQGGDVETLKEVLDKDKELVRAEDTNGWMPIHEASRGGHREAVELLLSRGADINARTNFGDGGTPLYWAQEEGHSQLADFLESLGALSIGPEL